MDNKAIIEKALKGEDYSELVKEYTDEQRAQLNIQIRDAANAEAKASLDRAKALKLEEERKAKKLNESPDPSNNPALAQEDTAKKLREENIGLAREKFFSDPAFPLNDQEKAAFEEEFNKLDSGKMSPELIIKDMKKAYAVVKSDELISAAQKAADMKRNADFYNAGGAFNQGSQPSPDDAKYSPAARKLYADWAKAGITGKTLEDAERVATQGLKRNLAA